MRATVTLFVALALLPLSWDEARAQGDAAERQAVTAASAGANTVPSWDLAGMLAWRQRRLDQVATGRREWYHDSAWFGAEAGRYWTEHLKTEAGVAAAPRDEIWSGGAERVLVAGLPYWESGVEHVRARRFFLNQVYQFGHNAWVHPFVGAGLQVLRERRDGIRRLYPVASPGPATEEVIQPRTEWSASAAVLAGAKLYFSRRGFVRTDGGVVLGKRVTEVLIRVGVGLDF